MYKDADKIKELVDKAHKIVVVQADNPDADSLGSALALEQILGEQGKDAQMYCAVDMPSYLHYLSGWDRVTKALPKQFDLSIIVDASTLSLLEKLTQSGKIRQLADKPCIVLDHHTSVQKPVDFAVVTINDHTRASCGELIYLIAKQLDWPLDKTSQEFIASSILGDTQGLTNSLAKAETYKIMAEFIEAGVDRPALEETRRAYSKMPEQIYRYKADLIQRTEFFEEGRIALVSIPQREINEFSPLYNPAPLIQGDMLQTSGVEVAIVLKSYDDGHITGAIRCNPTAPVAAKLATHLGGGGHDFASGFKIENSKPLNEVKHDCLSYVGELLKEISADKTS